jgi:uncharacterized protein (DUF2384 family)
MLATFLDEVIEARTGAISPRRMSKALHMQLAELSDLARVHRNSLRLKPGSAKVQSRLGDIAQIVSLAAELTGDKGRAIAWFRHQPLSGFDGRTAADLVQAGHADAVRKHLETLRDGGYA